MVARVEPRLRLELFLEELVRALEVAEPIPRAGEVPLRRQEVGVVGREAVVQVELEGVGDLPLLQQQYGERVIHQVNFGRGRVRPTASLARARR